MPAKRKTTAKSSAKKSGAKTPAKKAGAKRKPSAAKKKTTAAKPAPAEQVPAPGEEPPPAPEGQPPPETAAITVEAPSTPAADDATAAALTEAAAMDAAAMEAPTRGGAATAAPTPAVAPPAPPVPRRRNPLVVPFIIVLILLLIALAALGYVLFFYQASPTTTVATSTSGLQKKAGGGTSGKTTEGSCGDVTHPEDRAGKLDDAARSGGSDDKPDLVTSTPPTSGTHGRGLASNGSNYTSPQPLGYLVNAMDRGSVVIWHRGLSQEELKDLLDVANSNLRRDFAALIMVPYNDMKPRIALTAWGSLMECDGVNAEAINDFVTDYMATGPEGVAACLDMPENHPRCA